MGKELEEDKGQGSRPWGGPCPLISKGLEALSSHTNQEMSARSRCQKHQPDPCYVVPRQSAHSVGQARPGRSSCP